MHRRPRLHLLVTGSELLPLGAPPEPGRIHESNGLMVRPARRAARAPRWSTAASWPTTAHATLEAVERGLAGDVLVVSGGVSVGPHDHVKPAFEACGVEEVLWRVRIKPGKPMWFGPPRRHAGVRAARATRCRASSASACSSSPRCGACRASATRARGSCAAGSPRPPRPSDGRTTFLTVAHRARRRRRARGDPDRAPGLAHDRRARRERRASRSRRTAPPALQAGDAGGPAAAARSAAGGRAALRRAAGAARARGGR